MVEIAYVGLFFAIITAIVLFIWLLVVYFKEAKKDKNAPINVNFNSFIDEGRFLGTQTDSVKGSSGRYVIEMMPHDVDIDKIPDKKIKSVKLNVEPGKIMTFSPGILSRDKTINIILPPRMEDFPPEFLETKLGKALALITKSADWTETQTKMMREAFNDTVVHLKAMKEGEVSAARMSQEIGLMDDFFKIITKHKDDNKSTPYSTIHPNSSYEQPKY